MPLLYLKGDYFMKSKRTRMTVKFCYYQCEVCGRQIDSYEYYAYGKCRWCR